MMNNKSSGRKRDAALVSITPPRVTRSISSSQYINSPVKQIHKFPRRSARTNGPITCCDFGLDHLKDFSAGDFCHPCKLWDDRDPMNSRISCSSHR
jgi:hypothetical protein